MLSAELVADGYNLYLVRDDEVPLGYVQRYEVGGWHVLNARAEDGSQLLPSLWRSSFWGPFGSREEAVRQLPYILGLCRACPTCDAEVGVPCVVTDLDTGRKGTVRLNGLHDARLLGR